MMNKVCLWNNHLMFGFHRWRVHKTCNLGVIYAVSSVEDNHATTVLIPDSGSSSQRKASILIRCPSNSTYYHIYEWLLDLRIGLNPQPTFPNLVTNSYFPLRKAHCQCVNNFFLGEELVVSLPERCLSIAGKQPLWLPSQHPWCVRSFLEFF